MAADAAEALEPGNRLLESTAVDQLGVGAAVAEVACNEIIQNGPTNEAPSVNRWQHWSRM